MKTKNKILFGVVGIVTIGLVLGMGFAAYETNARYASIVTASSAITVYVNNENIKALSLEKNGGTGGDSSFTVTEGYQVPTIAIPSKDDFFFEGYFTDSADGTLVFTNKGMPCEGVSYETLTSGAILYAHWTANTSGN